MKKTVADLKKMKGREKISMLTCYDYSFARALDGKVDMILVGDSLGNVVLGYDRTKHVTLSDMARHLRAVRSGAPSTFVAVDLPYGTYDSERMAIETSQTLLSLGADAVKPEGLPDIVKALTKKGINVIGHTGLLPQSAPYMKVVGKTEEESAQLSAESRKLEENGAFCLVLECIPSAVAEKITKLLSIPSIGIGSGRFCDGQVLVLYDALGLYPDFQPRFARRYLQLQKEISAAAFSFSMDVKKESFPGKDESP